LHAGGRNRQPLFYVAALSFEQCLSAKIENQQLIPPMGVDESLTIEFLQARSVFAFTISFE
jgi:hypothetical protein